ncbi:MAG: HAMP domain-containing histidine kinase [Kiritimatiellae bacterium]|nr:HAMP domain-containing histidine kinase [Kiritimatiellia bacterium]
MSSKTRLDSTLPRRAFKVYASGYILSLLVSGALILFGAYHFTRNMPADDLARFFRFLTGALAFSFALAIMLGLVAAYRIIHVFDEVFSENYRALAELSTLTDNIAHDLRTPLTHLLSAAELAAIEGTVADLPATVAEESSAMLSMINTMLEISQSESRIERSPRETLDLCEIARKSAEFYRIIAEDRQIAFVLVLPDEPMFFSGHAAKLRQLLSNLVDNAFKFTPAGGEVCLNLSRTPSSLQITVSDTGCGISPSDAPHVFERFWRADSSRTLPGNGLGLALVKAIVTSYAGQVSFTSSSSGTAFVVTLPAINS